jgi:PST family polysaccharide transporter
MSFYQLLVNYGYDVDYGFHVERAKEIKGIYDRGFPLIQLGSVIASSFSLALIPFVSSALVRNEHEEIQKRIATAIRVSIVIGAAATVGLISIIHPTNIMLYRNELGTDVLSVLSISIIFAGLAITGATIAQGLGKSLIPAINVLIGGVVKLIGNILLMEHGGSFGAAYSTVIALAVVALLNLIYLYRLVRVKLFSLKFLMKLAVIILIMYYGVHFYEMIFEKVAVFIQPLRVRMLVEALTSAVIGALIFALLMLKIKLFKLEELSAVIKSKKLQKWLS